jgi:predicted permease
VLQLRFAFRLLLRQPALSSIAIITLALGIAATTTVFTVVYGVLLRPLPYREPDRLVMLLYGHQGRVSPWLSPSNFRDYVDQASVFADAAAIAPITANMTDSGDPERVAGARVSWNYFDVLGAPMALGRAFGEADAHGDAGRIILSYGLWQRRFGGRADIVDTTTTIDGRAMTIAGVASPQVRFPATAEFWQPLIFKPGDLAPEARGAQWVQVMARLDNGVSIDEAVTALGLIASRLAQAYPRTESGSTPQAIALHDRIVGNTQPALLLLFAAVTLVMIIACANVAGLLLARAQGREREMSMRAALGASRAQLVTQLLSESLVLGGAGTIAGTALALVPVRALVLLAPASIPRIAEIRVDGHVLAFAAGAAIITSLCFGLVPAIALSRRMNRGTVSEGGTRSRRVLVVSELALAVMLLTGAGLLIRSYVELQHVAPGFNPDNVVTFSLSLPAAKYSEPASVNAFAAALLSRVRGEAGVESSSVAMGLPFTSDLNALTGFRREGQPVPDSAAMPSASLRITTADYFKTMGIPLRAGRAFAESDTGAGGDVAIINERAAQRYFSGVNPIGEQIRVGAQLSHGARNGPKTIVGVVGNVKYGGLDQDTPAEIYLPFDQSPVDAFTVVVRSRGDAAALVPSLRRDVGAIDALLPLANISTMRDLVDASSAGRRLTLVAFVLFGAIAVTLSAVGVYGVLAFLVGLRMREIGLRLAIGATPPQVVWLFVREGGVLTVAGVSAGLAGALLARKSIAALLFGVTPADPATFTAAALILALVAACAIYLPARRAARIDPMEALRAD